MCPSTLSSYSNRQLSTSFDLSVPSPISSRDMALCSWYCLPCNRHHTLAREHHLDYRTLLHFSLLHGCLKLPDAQGILLLQLRAILTFFVLNTCGHSCVRFILVHPVSPQSRSFFDLKVCIIFIVFKLGKPLPEKPPNANPYSTSTQPLMFLRGSHSPLSALLGRLVTTSF